MTVTYTGQVANARLCAFSRLLFYWKGSIYKLMYKETLIFISLYTLCSITYRFFLHEQQKRLFERVVLYCETFTNLIPLSFVLGFYVAIVVTRWWNQFLSIPWPDRVMMYVSTVIEGMDERGRLLRRTIMRYLQLASLLVFQATSVSVKKRFPTSDHLIEAGILTENEDKVLNEITTPHGKWWIPFVWCFNIVKDAYNEGRIADSYLLKQVMDEVVQYRSTLGMLYCYDWISIPLVYTQVTTLATYTFFLGCIMGRQFLDPNMGYPGHDVDLYIPIFTLLQFFFYMGWLKVAEQMINPFGEDDDDFDMNWIIDRNMQVSYLGVDDMCGSYPTLEKDIYWDEPPPDYLPYTKSALSSFSRPFMGSTAQISISDEGMKVVNPMETIPEGETLQVPSVTFGLKSPAHSNPTLNVASTAGSPEATPSHTRRFHAIHNPLNISKKSIGEGLSGSHHHLGSHKNIPKHAAAYLSYLMNDKSGMGSHPELGGRIQSPRAGNSPIPIRRPVPRFQRGFSITSEHEEATTMSCSATMHDVASSLPTDHSFYCHPVGSPSKHFEVKPVADFRPSVPVTPPSSPIKVSVAFNIPELPISQPDVPPATDTTPSVSEKIDVPVVPVHIGGSDSCIVDFEQPELNQCTVNSLTPLLGDNNSEKDIAQI